MGQLRDIIRDLERANTDGVVIIERACALSLMALAEQKVAQAAARLRAIARGDAASKWLPAALRAAGVLNEGELP